MGRFATLAFLLCFLSFAALPSASARADEAQEQAIAALRDQGAIVVRDRERPDHPAVRVLTGLDPKRISQLAQLTDLRELEAPGGRVTDGDLRGLIPLRHLRKLSLDLRSCRITDGGIAALGKLPELEELTYVAWDTTDVGLKSLAGLSHLRSLTPACKSDGSGFAALKDLPNLQVIDLSGIRTSPAMLQQLQALPQLKELSLTCNKVLDAELKVIAELPALEKLRVMTGCTDPGLRSLTSSRTLKSLRLGARDITGEGVASLRDVPTLQELILFEYNRRGGALAQAVQISGLRSVGGDRATDAMLHDLRKLPHLSALHLAYSPITDAGLKELRDLTELEELDLESTNITDAGLKELANLKKLRRLSLISTEISDSGLAALGALTNLEELSLPARVGDAAMDSIIRLMNLRLLDLFCSDISDVGAAKLAQLHSLKSLTIGTSKLTDAGIDALTHLQNLDKLTVSRSDGKGLPSDERLRRMQDEMPFTEVRRP